jgi:hypothetical protein
MKRVIRLIIIIIKESPSSSTAYRILSNILLARLTLYIKEVIGDHQYGSDFLHLAGAKEKNGSLMGQCFHYL